MEFKDNLLKYRKEKGLSQEELALLCNVSRQAISKWENGLANPDMDNLKLLSRSLHVSIDELLGNMEVPKAEKVVYVKTGYGKEYTSKASFLQMPLVQVNIGRGKDSRGKRRVAKAWIAIGNTSIGLISLGFMSAGLFSLGIVTFGLIFAIGTLSLSYFAIGVLAIGYLSIGVMAIGAFSIGVLAIGYQLCVGVIAMGIDAVGIVAYGDRTYLIQNHSSCFLDKAAYDMMQSLLQMRSFPFIIKAILQMIPLC